MTTEQPPRTQLTDKGGNITLEWLQYIQRLQAQVSDLLARVEALEP